MPLCFCVYRHCVYTFDERCVVLRVHWQVFGHKFVVALGHSLCVFSLCRCYAVIVVVIVIVVIVPAVVVVKCVCSLSIERT